MEDVSGKVGQCKISEVECKVSNEGVKDRWWGSRERIHIYIHAYLKEIASVGRQAGRQSGRRRETVIPKIRASGGRV